MAEKKVTLRNLLGYIYSKGNVALPNWVLRATEPIRQFYHLPDIQNVPGGVGIVTLDRLTGKPITKPTARPVIVPVQLEPIKMPKTMSLPFRGDFEHVQSFGANPATYSKYGILGHDGDDYKMPEGTPIYAPFTGVIKAVGNDPNGWGLFIQCLDIGQRLLVIIGHLSRQDVGNLQGVKAGQRIGLSGNTGFSAFPHCHVAAADTDEHGDRINTNNGFKGWYSILDSGRIGLTPLPPEPAGAPAPVVPPGAPAPTAPGVNFEEIFAKYYIGWNKDAAHADFFENKKGDLNTLLRVRGITPGATPAPEAPRPEVLKKNYQILPDFVGLSLEEISGGGLPLGRTDVLAGFLGIDQKAKFTSGQVLNIAGFPTAYYPNSSEWEGLQKLVGLKPYFTAGNWYLKPEFANMNLHDIRDKTNLPFRSDILAGFLGISDRMSIPASRGFSTGGFPNFNDAGSGEVQGFKAIFTNSPRPPSPSEVAQPTGAKEGGLGAGVTPTEATIFVDSTPNKARFFIDGLYFRDLTPAKKPYPVSPGTHKVLVEKSGYESQEISVEVAEREQKFVKIDLKGAGATPTPKVPESSLGTAIAVEALAVRVSRIEKILREKGLG